MRPYRLSPPRLSDRVLLRPRLVERLLGRFDRRIVVVTAPPGFGKTTLLAQAVHENLLAPRGQDVWLTCEPADSDALGFGLAQALGASEPSAEAVAAAVWTRSPLHVAVLLDDVHEIVPGSAGATWLTELVAALPDNGHVVLAGRVEPPLPLARLEAQGEVLRLGADDLLFLDEELSDLAALCEVPPEALGSTGGWAALAALASTGAVHGADRFIGEEVLARLSPASRRALEVLSVLGGGDDALAAAALGEDVRLVDLVANIPLVQRHVNGWYRPHALWHDVVASTVAIEDQRVMRRRAAEQLRRRGELAAAAELLSGPALDEDDWLVLREVVADGCALAQWVARAATLGRWLDDLPGQWRETPEGLLLAGTVNRLQQGDGGDTVPLLERARVAAAEGGRVRAEVAALSQLGHIAWWRDDRAGLSTLFARLVELDRAGHPEAGAITGLGRAFIAELMGDDDAMLAELEQLDRSPLDPALQAAADWLHNRVLHRLGRAAEAIPLADRAAAIGGFQAARMARVYARWLAGQPEEAVAVASEFDVAAEATPRDRFLTAVGLAALHAWMGATHRATEMLAVATDEADVVDAARSGVWRDLITAQIAVATGDHERARDDLSTVVAAVASGGLVRELHAVLGLVYVVVPATREQLGAASLGPDQRQARDVAAALVAAREGGTAPVSASPGRVVTTLGVPLALELAARTGDRPLASYVLDLAGAPARQRLHELGRAGAPVGPGARDLLRALPSRPVERLRLCVLGPAALVRDGVPVDDADWRRERVRSLLLFLSTHPRSTRAAVAAALWPDLDGAAAGGNLRTTLGYLQKVLEPRRVSGDAPFFLRADGNVLELAVDELDVDARIFESHLDEAAAAEAAGAPSRSLAELEAALVLWRGEPFDDVYDDWAGPERDRLRARYTAAAVRAGELLLAAGQADRALEVGTRAVESEPLSEAAHRLVLAAHLARRDRAAARRALDRCYRALDELGVNPEPETVMLERAILS